MVSFLKRIGLAKYTDKFLDEDVDGSTLLAAGRETFEELGVKSVLDWIRVVVLYRRELQRGDSEEPARVLQELLKREKNLAQYATKMEQTGVDADMILYASRSGCREQLLAEVGVKKALHRTKIVAAVKSQYTPSSLASLFSSSVNM